MKLGILGGTGWLGRGLGLGLLRAGLWDAPDLVILNRSGDRTAYGALPVVWAQDMAQMQRQCEVIVLSVRPQDFPVAGFDPGGRLVISFMAGWSMERLRALAPDARWVRAMPNGGAISGQSYTPWLAEGLTPADDALVQRILSGMGAQQRIETEDHLDYLTALSGSGAAYPALMARAMLADAQARGLSLAVAQRAVEAVICGSTGLLAGQMGQIDTLLDCYRSYRGITAAGLDAAQAAGFETAVQAALSAATVKAQAMGRG